MGSFKAYTHYGDWEGTAAADDAHNSINEYLTKNSLIKDDEFLVAVTLGIGEKSVLVRGILHKGQTKFEDVQKTLAETQGPIPVRVVDVPLTLDEFSALFKQLDIILTWRDLPIEDREYSEVG